MLCGDLNGKEIPKRGIFVCIGLIDFVEQQILTQQYEATIVQFFFFSLREKKLEYSESWKTVSMGKKV